MRAPQGFLAVTLLAAAARPVCGQDTTRFRFANVSAGGAHSCAVTPEGAAYCWGRNDHGQLGDSSTTDRPAPVPVAGGLTFHGITTGEAHTCGIAADDTPYCWGANDHGQLGIGRTGDQNSPSKIAFSTSLRMGRMRVSAISAGARHTCALIIHYEQQDRMFCWGDNSHGQLGTRDLTGRTHDVFSPVAPFGVIRYAAVAAGNGHTCAVAKSVTAGSLFCWGDNSRGELGNASRTSSAVPFPIRRPGRTNFSSVTAGATHTCALTSEGAVYCWGDNAAGQLGTGKGGTSLAPARLADSVTFVALSAGGDATCGLRRDGGVSCWGSNAAGQFGTGAATGSPTPVPAVPGLTLTAITLGRAHACGLQADGATYCWGQLASGVGASNTEPRRVGSSQ